MAADSAEVEITEDMIDAGEDALLGCLGGAVSTNWDARELAVAVFMAMSRPSTEGTRD